MEISRTATREDIRNWLGDFADQATDDQLDQLATISDIAEQRWPDPDDRDSREQALSGAARVILGDDTLDSLGAALRRARLAERTAMDRLVGAVLASSTGARSPRPGSEADLVERSGLSRMTVRKILGL